MTIKQAFVLGLALSFGVGLGTTRPAAAQEKPEVGVSAEQSIVDVFKLAEANNLHVYVNLKGGVQYAARVKGVGAAAVVLKEPSGKEFYEVYIPFEAIASVEVRVRKA